MASLLKLKEEGALVPPKKEEEDEDMFGALFGKENHDVEHLGMRWHFVVWCFGFPKSYGLCPDDYVAGQNFEEHYAGHNFTGNLY